MATKARAFVTNIAAWLYGGYVWTMFTVLLLLCGGLAILLRKPSAGRPVARFGTRAMLALARMPHYAIGLERLPHTPHVLLVNHASFLDAIVLTALLPSRPGYAFAVRQEFPIQRLLCPLLRSLGTLVLISPHTKARRTKNVTQMTAALRRGQNLVVFPEGGFARAPGLKPFHSGAFVAAANAGVPIAVAGLRGTRAALPSKTWLPHRVPLALEIGPVFATSEKDPEAVARLSAAARKAMVSLSGEFDPLPAAPESR